MDSTFAWVARLIGFDLDIIDRTRYCVSMTQRTDTHSPSNFDPAEYTYAGFVDQHHEEGFEDIEDERANNLPYWRDSVPGRYNGCDHCGQSGQRYLALFIHEPTQQVVVTGTICANRLSLASRSELDARRHAEEHARRVKYAEFLAASSDNRRLMEALDARTEADGAHRQAMSDWNDRFEAVYDPREGNRREAEAAAGPMPKYPHRNNNFLTDLAFKARRYGSLSDAQVAAGLRAIDRDAEFQARRDAQPKPTTPLEEGRREMSGTVVSTKYVDSEYGSTFKMLVVLDDLNKVWGTVPAAIDCDPKDMRVTFTATVERSRDDEHFGFFKRPSKAQVIDTERTES